MPEGAANAPIPTETRARSLPSQHHRRSAPCGIPLVVRPGHWNRPSCSTGAPVPPSTDHPNAKVVPTRCVSSREKSRLKRTTRPRLPLITWLPRWPFLIRPPPHTNCLFGPLPFRPASPSRRLFFPLLSFALTGFSKERKQRSRAVIPLTREFSFTSPRISSCDAPKTTRRTRLNVETRG
jgi:hypothetical protein